MIGKSEPQLYSAAVALAGRTVFHSHGSHSHSHSSHSVISGPVVDDAELPVGHVLRASTLHSSPSPIGLPIDFQWSPADFHWTLLKIWLGNGPVKVRLRSGESPVPAKNSVRRSPLDKPDWTGLDWSARPLETDSGACCPAELHFVQWNSSDTLVTWLNLSSSGQAWLLMVTRCQGSCCLPYGLTNDLSTGSPIFCNCG